MRSGIYKLKRDFYIRPTLEVAEDLLNKFIVFHSPEGKLSARIVEVEAYIGEDDPACHASVGKTKRNEIMYAVGGFSYVYFIYGMYHCFNVVTERVGFPAAILVRGAEPVEGIELMMKNSGKTNQHKLTDGPGKLCLAFNINKQHNGLDLTGSDLYLEDRGYELPTIGRSCRIGIKKGIDKLWRIYEKDSPYLSRK